MLTTVVVLAKGAGGFTFNETRVQGFIFRLSWRNGIIMQIAHPVISQPSPTLADLCITNGAFDVTSECAAGFVAFFRSTAGYCVYGSLVPDHANL